MRGRAYHIKLDPLLVDYDIKIPDVPEDLSKAFVALIPCPPTYYHKLVRIDKCIYDPSVDINTLAVSIDMYRKVQAVLNEYESVCTFNFVLWDKDSHIICQDIAVFVDKDKNINKNKGEAKRGKKV